jgi:hypothetical protein
VDFFVYLLEFCGIGRLMWAISRLGGGFGHIFHGIGRFATVISRIRLVFGRIGRKSSISLRFNLMENL